MVSAQMTELLTPDIAGKLPDADTSPSIAAVDGGSFILKLGVSGHLLPLQQMKKPNFWSLPFNDVKSASRTLSGDYVVQSMGGDWIARYDSTLSLVSSHRLEAIISPGRLVVSSADWQIYWQDTGSVATVNLGDLNISSDSQNSIPVFVVTESVKLIRGQGGRYRYEVDGKQVNPAVLHDYPGSHISSAFIIDAGSFTLIDAYGSRKLVNGAFGMLNSTEVPPFRILGSLSGPKPIFASCGKWSFGYESGSYTVSMSGRSVLDSSGIPFCDKIKDADAMQGELVVDVDSHLAFVDAHGVRLVLPRPKETSALSSARIACRFVCVDNSSERLLAVSGLGAGLIQPVDGSLVEVTGDVSLPYATIETRKLSIVGADLGATLQLRLKEVSSDSSFIQQYDGTRMFAGSQLAVDRVDSILSGSVGIVVEHPAGRTMRSSRENFGWQSVLPRHGPQLTVGTESQLFHPWSEPREWEVSAGGLIWTERGHRWGD
jgi:hypothetical protein